MSNLSVLILIFCSYLNIDLLLPRFSMAKRKIIFLITDLWKNSEESNYNEKKCRGGRPIRKRGKSIQIPGKLGVTV